MFAFGFIIGFIVALGLAIINPQLLDKLRDLIK